MNKAGTKKMLNSDNKRIKKTIFILNYLMHQYIQSNS